MRYYALLAFVLFLTPDLQAAEPKLDELAPHASGVALVEVVSVEEYDARPADGDAGVCFKFKLVRGSGEFRSEVRVTTAPGGLRPPGFVPKPSLPLKPDSLKKGERYWLAFASGCDYEKHNQGIIDFLGEKDPKAKVLDAAVKADTFRWHPQYDPKTKLTYGRVSEKDKWRVRVEKDAKVLWEKEIPGTRVDAYASWGLWGGLSAFEVKMPACGVLLLAETHTRLGKDNEFGLEAGAYYINTGFDPETGMRRAICVRFPQGPSVTRMNREYDADTGLAVHEERYDTVLTGGKAVGAKTESWYRKITRTFAPAGKLAREDIFFYDADIAESEKRWVQVKP
ncbi:unnamed protein product [Gemmata massiliana]|uniref:DUF4861 domain-containing protein n=1 Tax=Gemmata massiliana TaxID=1210884 RepID=A0A6P2DDZ8_9BACT|nr:hypothetical protein [Gemmata massiliana]VTR99627.1 unnamed protein product [Gemmata massiliana]